MPLIDPFRPFIETLEVSQIPYCITGSVASGIYGESRLTRDIDFVMLLRTADVGKLLAAFPAKDFYVPPTETLLLEIARSHRGMFNLIHQPQQVKADIFIAARDPLHQWALDHRRRVHLGDIESWLAPPEYVIIRKLEAYREGGQEKHPRDVMFMLAVTEVDQRFLEVNVERLGLGEQWLVCQPESR